MSGRVESRKRSREDDGGEMPLSKRINNLHLTNPEHGLSSQTFRPGSHMQPGTSSSAVVNSIEQDILMTGDRPHHIPHSHLEHNGHNGNHNSHQHQHHSSQSHISHHQQHNHHQSPHSPLVHRDAAGYDPELNQTDNPHYYQKNKLLYELHFMRSRRCHPDNN